jgi:glyoxylase-like metal-dependent hydrolase (beta-lactamase superfamily II)
MRLRPPASDAPWCESSIVAACGLRLLTPQAPLDAVAKPGGTLVGVRPAHYESTAVRVEKVVVGPYENNAYVVRCRRSGEAILVDAANEHELLVPLCRALGVRRVLTTHGHFDHIQAVEACRDAGIDVGVAAEDAKMLPSYDFVIGDEDVIEVGDLRLQAIHTPGHTPGSTSFLLEGEPLLFTGDTLFPGGPGNTVFEGASFEQIIASIDRRLFTLPPDLLVLPGHGLDTTLGTERPHLQEWVDRGW